MDNNGLRLIVESDGEGGDEQIASLNRWLLQDSDFSEVSITATSGGRYDGEMSGTLEAVCAVASQVSSLGGLTLAYLTWRSSRRPTPENLRVTLEVGGQRIQVENLTDAQLRNLIEGLNRGEAD